MKIRERARKAGGWLRDRWHAIKPGPEAATAARRALAAVALVHVLLVSFFLRLGFGFVVDVVFSLVAAALIALAVFVILFLLIRLLRHRQPKRSAVVVASLLLTAIVWGPPQIGLVLAAWIGAAAAALAAAIAMWIIGEKKRVMAFLFLAGLAGGGGYIWMIAHDGSLDRLSKWKPPAASMPPALTIPNPTERGPFPVKTTFYGAGTDIRRAEFGPRVAIRSRTVDATEFFRDFEGWRRRIRKLYWGFDLDKLPLNARVWYPDGPGPFPLALIVHGNHNMVDFSDPGYGYLGELMASRGFIFVSIDENFLNGGLFGEPEKQQPVRGWLLLEHLKLWREWNGAGNHAFAGKVDVERVALLGHSRGGEAVATAALFNRLRHYPDNANIRFDYGYPIRALVAIAPVDGQYKPAGAHRWIDDISYLTLHGSHDADVSSFHGSRQWDHLRFSKPGPWFKAELWSYRANHGQFNTSWGKYDGSPPMGWMINTRPLLSGEDQRRISKTYISAFLEATLHDRTEYKSLFADWRAGRHWLPETIFISRYRDTSYNPLAAYDEDADLTTATAPGVRIAGDRLLTWREGRIPWRSGNRDYNGVFLGWKHNKDQPAASYTLRLPEDAPARWRMDANTTLEFSIAALDEDPKEPAGDNKKKKTKAGKEDQKKERESPDFTLQLITPAGSKSLPLSRFQSVPPPLKEKLAKLHTGGDQKDWEPVFQTIRVPLSAFGITPSQFRALRLQFDRSQSAAICISAIGFGQEVQ
ncbi:MAG: hypothetical protein HY820_27225 [Acidobacteria bacterium]|nr:hypothetical protein [Acidobacteriota bacterium]